MVNTKKIWARMFGHTTIFDENERLKKKLTILRRKLKRNKRRGSR